MWMKDHKLSLVKYDGNYLYYNLCHHYIIVSDHLKYQRHRDINL